MRPFAQNHLCAFLVGVFVASPAIIGIVVMEDGLPANERQVLTTALLIGVLAGPVFALALWEEE